MHVHYVLAVLATTCQALEIWPIQRVNRWIERSRSNKPLGDPKLIGSSLVFAYNEANENYDQTFVGHHSQKTTKEKYQDFEEKSFVQPLDHFSPSQHADTWFEQRYWVNSRHYKAGGPVIVLDGGETSGEDRLPFLDSGIVDILANATHGLGIVLEHRYYGKSIPVQNFSTDALRFLNNAQSLQDSARFMSNFKWNGSDLLAAKNGTKWIYYGGSYAGARAAHMRVLYPDIVWGSIASSAVTHAAIDYWEYNEAIRTTANQTCIKLLAASVGYIDSLLSSHVPFAPGRLKVLFGLQGLDTKDFVSVLSEPLGYVQMQNWDQSGGSGGSEGDPEGKDVSLWNKFCGQLGQGDGVRSKWAWVRSRGITHNYAKWIREEIVSPSCADGNVTRCFGTSDAIKYQNISIQHTWRAWTWQVCNEWGYFIGAPPDPSYPRIVSKYLTLDYTSKICRQAFPAGEYTRVPAWPNVTAVNILGDYNLAMDWIAFVDGDEDPWRPATPHSWHAKARRDTVLRPFKIIKSGVHHYDENGLKDPSKEPSRIRAIHEQEVDFVKSWLNM